MRTYLLVGTLIAGTSLWLMESVARSSGGCEADAKCWCIQDPIDVVVRRAPFAFVGKVVAEVREKGPPARNNICIRVLHGWQGDPPDSLVVVDRRAGTDCELELPKDSSVFLALTLEERGWRVAGCGYTVGLVGRNREALAALGKPRYSRAD